MSKSAKNKELKNALKNEKSNKSAKSQSKRTLAKVLEVVFHVLGFPLLLVLLAVASIATIKGGLGYGIPVFIGLILTAVLAIVYYVAYIILTVGEKKRREKIKNRIQAAERNGSFRPSPQDPGIRTGIILAIIAVCCLSGLWVAVDTLLPNAIADATSNTVYWEDLTDNWQARGEVHEDLLDTFIKRAYYAGNLKNKSLNEYLKEGIRNKEVKQLIDDEFASIDKNGYGTYIGPAISLAQDERMTIPALVHLLLDVREPIKDANGNRLDKQIPLATFNIVYSDPDAVSIDTTLNYHYMRHNKKYYIYNEDFTLESDNTQSALIVVEENVGYRKIKFLDANGENRSFVYVIDSANGLDISCSVIVLDKVVASSSISKTNNGYLLKDENGETNSYTSLDDAFASHEHYEFLIGVNPLEITAEYFLQDEIELPNGWMGFSALVLRKSTYLAYADWNVLDMLGEPMGFNLPLSSIADMQIPILNISGAELLTQYAPAIDDVLATAGELTAQKELLGSKLTITLDFETGDLSLVPCNEERGTLDYMRTAWLYNNGLLYVLVSLFSTRKLYLIFAAVIALTSFLIGYMHELARKEENSESNKNNANTEDEPVDDDDVSFANIDA